MEEKIRKIVGLVLGFGLTPLLVYFLLPTYTVAYSYMGNYYYILSLNDVNLHLIYIGIVSVSAAIAGLVSSSWKIGLISGIVDGMVGAPLTLVFGTRVIGNQWRPSPLYELSSMYSQPGSIVVVLVLYAGLVGAIVPTIINKLNKHLTKFPSISFIKEKKNLIGLALGFGLTPLLVYSIVPISFALFPGTVTYQLLEKADSVLIFIGIVSVSATVACYFSSSWKIGLITGLVDGLVLMPVSLVLGHRFYVGMSYWSIYPPDSANELISMYSQSSSRNIVILLALYGGVAGAVAPTTINKVTKQLKNKLQRNEHGQS